MAVLIIAECGSNWRFGEDHLANAYRMIHAAKDCGADVAKFQWTSSGYAMVHRRAVGIPTIDSYKQFVEFPKDWLPLLKAKCDEVGIEFMCTVYLPQDCDMISRYANRGKISAYESQDEELISCAWARFDELIVSRNPDKPIVSPIRWQRGEIKVLHCISKYPCPLEELDIACVDELDGLSDHTTSLISGAVAVGCGATIIEKHVRLRDTPKTCPDYGHSLRCSVHPALLDSEDIPGTNAHSEFREYVRNIREAERML